MSNAKHTPGPWKFEAKHNFIIGPDDGSVCQIDRYNQQAKANARLIAAAPELLEALETLLLAVEVDKVPGLGLATDKARAAIAKAEGRK